MPTPLKTKTQNALDEGRTLILGAQILLGVLSRAVFEPGFHKMPAISKYLVLSSLSLIVIATIILIAPAPHHRIVEHGRDTQAFNTYLKRIMFAGLLPFALSFGLAVYVAAEVVAGAAWAGVAGLLTTFLALFFWYGMAKTAPKLDS
jgi:Family of unknown function (DUF6328)